MKQFLLSLFALIHAAFSAETTLTGNIFKIDPSTRSFELLKETEYDPKSDIGKSRFTIKWNSATIFTRVEDINSFHEIKGPVHAKFYGIDNANRKALADGQPFVARVAEIHPTEQTADPNDANTVAGLFTPSEGGHSGMIMIKGKSILVSLRPNNSRIIHHSEITPADLTQGFWKTTIRATTSVEPFIASAIQVTSLPDTRRTDDPNLPRVLVIGDSISMNYHEAAKSALRGIANYHRNEGNAASSTHGVQNIELWLGNYQEKGLHWDVIQFNHGLHDLKQTYDPETDAFGDYSVPIETYKKNLEKQIAILRKTGAQLIWCSTTPVPNDNKSQYARRKGAEKEYNLAALEIISRHPEILITDLAHTVDHSRVFDEWRATKDVHFYKPEEQQALGRAVAETIKNVLRAGQK